MIEDPTRTAPRDAGGVHASVMDCIQVNLGVLADRFHGTDTHLRLGAPLRFDVRPLDPSPGALPTVEPELDERVASAARLLGLATSERDAGDLTGGPLYAVADAYALPWGPYFERQHMEHSFLVLDEEDPDRATVVDAYHNDTEWGPARPGWHSYPRDELEAHLAGAGLRLFDVEPCTPGDPPGPEANRDHLTAAETDAARDRYVAAYREHPDPKASVERLTLETWLLARDRALHAAWQCADPRAKAADRARDHARAWAGFAEQVYVGLRRVRRDRPAPDLYGPLAGLLAEDAELAERSAA